LLSGIIYAQLIDSELTSGKGALNAELCKQALEKVGNPNLLVNIVSRRLRQLNAGGGGGSRPLVVETAGQGVADIVMREIIEDKIGYEMLAEDSPEVQRKKPHAKSGVF